VAAVSRLITLGAVLVVGSIALGAVGPALAQVLDALTRLVVVVGLLWLASYVVRSFWPR
jgi:hypothetical protein